MQPNNSNKNKLLELKSSYYQGAIDKYNYIQKMHNIHQYLFDYAEFIKSTDISKIEIIKHQVIMTTKNTPIKFLCDKNDERIAPIEILNFDYYEQGELKMMLKVIKPRYNILDIGANFGWYSLNLSKKFPNSKIYAFEPIPKTYQYLKKNIAVNNLKNIEIFNFGFSNDEKQLNFYVYPEQSGNASLINLSGKKYIQKIKSLVKILDNFVKQKRLKIDFIKCDVEGAELFVFQGATDTLKRDKPVVFCEMLRKFSAKFNYHPNDIIVLFKHFGYKCFIVNKNKLSEISDITEDTIETNFFFLHAQKHLKLIKQLII